MELPPRGGANPRDESLPKGGPYPEGGTTSQGRSHIARVKPRLRAGYNLRLHLTSAALRLLKGPPSLGQTLAPQSTGSLSFEPGQQSLRNHKPQIPGLGVEEPLSRLGLEAQTPVALRQ